MLKTFLTYQWALELYRDISRIRTKHFISDQIQRASLSVVLNLAEGAGRWGKKDQKRFYRIALGSLREVEACLDVLDKGDLSKELRGKLGSSLLKLCS